MKNKYLSLLLVTSFSLFTITAKANDSTATLGTGGIELTETDKIQMLSEDLYISPNKVKVSYQFKNTSSQPITTLVAFPLPKLPPAEMNYDISHSKDPLNYVNFKIWVNGKAIAPTAHYKAFVEGKDVTQLLIENNVPLNLADPEFINKLDNLSLETKQKLRAEGALYFEDGDKYVFSPWDFQVIYSWEQTFKPNSITMVRHEYTPIVGRSFLVESRLPDFKKEFCMDKHTEAGIKKKIIQQSKNTEVFMHNVLEVDYIVKTANNWKGPINQFNLTIDKQSPNNIVSFCGNGFKKVGPTQFKTSKTNFTPNQDIQIMIVQDVQNP